MKPIPVLVAGLLGLTLIGCSKTVEKPTQPPVAKAPVEKELKVEEESDTYKTYSAQTYQDLRGDQPFVVFFHADWCGTCRNWEKKIKEKMGDLPENAVILKADYDAETDLVKDLHVKKQSNAVFFNSKGEIVDVIADPSVEMLSEFFSSPESNVFDVTGDKYIAYSDGAEAGKKSVLFFHADWCGTCRKWEKNLQSNIEGIPSGAQIFKVNYDQANDLRKKYSITKQSQAVFLDETGNVVKTEGDPSLESINDFFSEA